ncbi:SRPBCC family protein [Arenimonas fontis]|uniref:Vanillate O-demethylase oxidoreductase VanB n=1 Tax=Arenimonas fontis TaxID=2608255 RepID=A0A5B2ZAK7_9GAMM|nr:SRPBCC family protein [Arenimonas fontis]KAA2284583.1 vanillate O-demethylase oxidoreductase VanB [Arenimonas fontis]
MNDTDRIVRRITLNAPLPRVWRALTDSERFGIWFGARFAGPFQPGKRLRARLVPTRMDAEIARAQEAFEGMEFDIVVERMEPMRLFSFRWHPGGDPVETPESAPPDEQMTLVEFTLEQTAEGVLLTVEESGFDRVPPARRARAFADNAEGWTVQMDLVARYLAAERD